MTASPNTPIYSKLSILIPVYNEEKTLEKAIQAVLNAPIVSTLSREIILVDDCSKDRTWEVMQTLAEHHPEIKTIRHSKNQGKGAAIRTAIGHMSGDLAIFQDADLEYTPEDYPQMLKPLLDGNADVVIGSRFLGGSGSHRVLYFWHSLGNQLLTLLSNMLNDINLTDMETCYKAFDAAKLKTLHLEANRFGIEPEVTAKAARARWRIYEVPVSYFGRTYAEGKKITWRDGVSAFYWIVYFRFFSRLFKS